MSVSKKLKQEFSPTPEYLAWKKKLRRQYYVLGAIIAAPVVFLYILLFRLILAR